MDRAKIYNLIHLLVVLLIPLYLVLAYYLPPLVVILSVGLYILHIKIFDGCIITKIQKEHGGLSNGMDFMQNLFYKLSNKELSKQFFRVLNLILLILLIVLSLI